MVFCHFRRKTTSKDMYHQTKMCHYNPKTTNHHWYGTMAPISFGRFVTIQPSLLSEKVQTHTPQLSNGVT
jgi:hypothetical protein